MLLRSPPSHSMMPCPVDRIGEAGSPPRLGAPLSSAHAPVYPLGDAKRNSHANEKSDSRLGRRASFRGEPGHLTTVTARGPVVGL